MAVWWPCLAHLASHVSPGVLPWNAFPGKVCGSNLLSICKTSEVRTSVTPCVLPSVSGLGTGLPGQHTGPWALTPSSLAVPDDFPPLHRSLRGGSRHTGLTGELVLPLPGCSPPPSEDVGAEDNRGGGHGCDRACAHVIFWHISADGEFGP